jgi:S-methylmethionine-dependent homocysteine/selenocysteine methylase
VARADIILLEMTRYIEQTEVCLEAAYATGLPVWPGISCVINDDEPRMIDGLVLLDTFMQRFAGEPVEAIAIMHTETEDIDVMQQHWHDPIGVYAQRGDFQPPVWVFIDVVSAQDDADACMGWIDRGVQIIGSCCDIGHEHIAHLRPELTLPKQLTSQIAEPKGSYQPLGLVALRQPP